MTSLSAAALGFKPASPVTRPKPRPPRRALPEGESRSESVLPSPQPQERPSPWRAWLQEKGEKDAPRLRAAAAAERAERLAAARAALQEGLAGRSSTRAEHACAWAFCTAQLGLPGPALARVVGFATAPALVRLPDRCAVHLTAANFERGARKYSSAQVLSYYTELDCGTGTVYVEPWRSCDHDRLTLRGSTGEVQGVRQHWMSGDREARYSITPFDLRAALDAVSGFLVEGPLGDDSIDRLEPRPAGTAYRVIGGGPPAGSRCSCLRGRHDCRDTLQLPIQDFKGVGLKGLTVLNGVPTACVLCFCTFNAPDVEYRVTCTRDACCMLCGKGLPASGGRAVGVCPCTVA